MNDAKEFISFSQKQKYDEGYFYEETNSINLLNCLDEKKYIINPKIMYFIKESEAKKLIKNGIINNPKDFSFPKKYQKRW